MSEKVTDAGGTELKVGSRVALCGYFPGEGDAAAYNGEVVAISELDGDVDEHGRPVAITPRVVVRFDDGQQDGFGTALASAPTWADYPDGPDGPWVCGDLRLSGASTPTVAESGYEAMGLEIDPGWPPTPTVNPESGRVACVTCRGTGGSEWDDGEWNAYCPTCGGNGEV